MKHVVIIIGLSGIEQYLCGVRGVHDKKEATTFGSERAANDAWDDYLKRHPPVVQRALRFRTEPYNRGRA